MVTELVREGTDLGVGLRPARIANVEPDLRVAGDFHDAEVLVLHRRVVLTQRVLGRLPLVVVDGDAVTLAEINVEAMLLYLGEQLVE